MRGARLVRACLVDAHLDILDLRLGVHPEDAFHAAEVLECQPELRRPSVSKPREAHHSILAPFRQSDDQLEATVKFCAPRARRHEQQVVAVFAGQHIGLDLEAVDRKRVGAARLRREHALESGQLLAHLRVLLLEDPDLLRELLLRRALDRQAALGRIGDRAQALELGLRRRELARRHRELALDLALIEAGEAPAGVVDPRRGGGRDGEQQREAEPPPVPRQVRIHRNARRRDAEALADLEPSAGDVAHQGTTGGWSKARVSGKPNMRFMFCTACPAAPFTRLSITLSTTKVSDLPELSGGRCSAMRQTLAARTERVSGWLPGGMTSMNGSRS